MVGLRVGTAAVDHSTYSAMQVGKCNDTMQTTHVAVVGSVGSVGCLAADFPVLRCSFISAATGHLSDEKNQWVANTGGNRKFLHLQSVQVIIP